MNELFQKIILGSQTSESISKNIQILQSDNQAYIRQKQLIQLKMKSLPKQIEVMLTQIESTLKNNQNHFQKQFFCLKKELLENQLENIQCYSQIAKTLKLIVQEYIKINVEQISQKKSEQKIHKLCTFIENLKNISLSCSINSNKSKFDHPKFQNQKDQKRIVNFNNKVAQEIHHKLKQNIIKIGNKCEQILVLICKKYVSTKNNSMLIIIEKKNILNNLKMLKTKKQILQKYFNKILNDCISYQIQYQQFIVFVVQSIEQNQNQIKVKRQKITFKKQDASRYTHQIYQTLQKHINLTYHLLQILNISLQNQQNYNSCVNELKTELRSTLSYIFPYLVYEERVKFIKLLSHDLQNQRFQYLLISLKTKNKAAQHLMQNIEEIFQQLITKQKNNLSFKQEKFDLLLNFLQLSIFQFQQSILKSSSKALTKIAKNTILGKPKINNDHQKKMFNIILLTTSTLIQKIQEVCEQNNEGDQWINSLLWVRQNVRRKIHLIEE